MTNLEQCSFTRGISYVLAQPDMDRIMMNLKEMYDLCACSGTMEEAEIIGGLYLRRRQVEELNDRVRKGKGLSFDRIVEASNYEEPEE
ncbi:hypothetical protein SAMN02910292_00050 [Lachnospiraceae bacterium XBB2008]|nr:hypothetical protein SAMN02910292_00050 [Lachnospiraceae bacterium XBB2008]